MNETKKIKLAENVNLYVVPCKIFKKIRITFFIPTELDDDCTYSSLIPSVLKRGCRSYPDQKSIEYLSQELYGTCFSCGIRQFKSKLALFFSAGYVDGQYLATGEDLTDSVLDFLYEEMYMPVTENGKFKSDYVAQEAFNQKKSILSEINDKDHYAFTRLLEEMAPGEAFTKNPYGKVEELENIDENHLFEVYQKIMSSYPIDIFIVGDVDEEKMADKLKRKFNFNDKMPYSPCVPEMVYPKEVKYRTEEMDVKQGKLYIAFRTDYSITESDYYDVVLMNVIFGSGTNSKLFMNVREKASLCYSIWSFYSRLLNIVVVATGIDCDNYDKAYSMVKEQLREIRDGNVSDFELEAAKKEIISRVKSSYDSPIAIVMDKYTDIISGVDVSYEEYINGILGVTKEGVCAAAKRLYEDTVYFLKKQ